MDHDTWADIASPRLDYMEDISISESRAESIKHTSLPERVRSHTIQSDKRPKTYIKHKHKEPRARTIHQMSSMSEKVIKHHNDPTHLASRFKLSASVGELDDIQEEWSDLSSPGHTLPPKSPLAHRYDSPKSCPIHKDRTPVVTSGSSSELKPKISKTKSFIDINKKVLSPEQRKADLKRRLEEREKKRIAYQQWRVQLFKEEAIKLMAKKRQSHLKKK
ncbi:hypothetical protein ADUPG1_012096 [Aduncisulcus paluster]|uniref:ALMS motif domain-containing protein n=1 Tax=Aduncisulcus paluster TaxID=2918883 RepID=A0ABQ5JYA9_9EUKA|nr:hypothetical protein ADUPG1_012096 [Aduncisulcus paluster]